MRAFSSRSPGRSTRGPRDPENVWPSESSGCREIDMRSRSPTSRTCFATPALGSPEALVRPPAVRRVVRASPRPGLWAELAEAGIVGYRPGGVWWPRLGELDLVLCSRRLAGCCSRAPAGDHPVGAPLYNVGTPSPEAGSRASYPSVAAGGPRWRSPCRLAAEADFCCSSEATSYTHSHAMARAASDLCTSRPNPRWTESRRLSSFGVTRPRHGFAAARRSASRLWPSIAAPSLLCALPCRTRLLDMTVDTQVSRQFGSHGSFRPSNITFRARSSRSDGPRVVYRARTLAATRPSHRSTSRWQINASTQRRRWRAPPPVPRAIDHRGVRPSTLDETSWALALMGDAHCTGPRGRGDLDSETCDDRKRSSSM